MISKAMNYFEKEVLNALSPQKEDDTYSTLIELINSDKDISDDNRNYLISLRQNNELGKFLAETFLYAIQKNNKIEKKNNTKRFKISSLEGDINQLNEFCAKLPKPIKLTPEDNFEDHETIYISELFAAYTDANGVCEITKENLKEYPKYKNDFDRQRTDYFAAESIRQSARDIFYIEEIDQFNILKEDTLSGIINTHERYYCNGFERLNRVMEHVTTVHLSKSLLTRIPNWIGNSEKKGLCHMLVNDRQIKWVAEDE